MSRLFAFVNNDTGNVESIIDIGLFATNYTDGQVQGEHTMFDVTDRSDLDVLMSERAYKNGEWIMRPPQPNIHYDWDNATESWVLSPRLMEEVRAKRNKLLLGSDWTQMPDAPLSDAAKAQWADYRQALRDLPQNVGEITSLGEVVWPIPPN